MPNAFPKFGLPYVGVRHDLARERFHSTTRPKPSTHPHYVAVLGPFKTAGAADLAVKIGPHPSFTSVASYERAYRRNPDLALTS